MKAKRSTIYDVIGLLAYKVILDLVYVFFICDEYALYEFYRVEFEPVRFCESWFLLVLLVVLLPKEKTIVSYYLHIQLVLMVVPMLAIYGLSIQARYFMYLICSMHAIQCVLERVVKIRPMQRNCLKWGSAVNKGIIIFITGSVLLLTLTKFGFPDLRALNLYNVYEVRAENVASGYLSYTLVWVFNVIMPIIIVWGIVKKKIGGLLLFGVIAFLLYLTYAMKSWLFAALLVPTVFVVIKREQFTKACCIGAPLFAGLSVLFYEISGKFLLLPSLFVRRLLFIPASIKFAYFDFFCEREKLFFSEGLIGKVFGMESIYEKRISLIIGDELGISGTSCNTGYLADAFANAGTIGVISFALLLFCILKFLDIVLQKEDFVINFSILSYSFFLLNDGALLTSLLTGGLALLGLMLVLGRGKWIKGESEGIG